MKQMDEYHYINLLMDVIQCGIDILPIFLLKLVSGTNSMAEPDACPMPQ